MKKMKILIAIFLISSFVVGQNYIADQRVAKEEVLRSIPHNFLKTVRDSFQIAYQHTSHGTHVTAGCYGLINYKSGDDTLFAVSNGGTKEPGKFHIKDESLFPYAEDGIQAEDLSEDETAFIQTTRNYLNDPSNLQTNIIMWSWCNIAYHDVVGNYLTGMDSLINEYGPGGTNPRAAENPVTFIFMTGHANVGDNIGEGKPESQANLILNYCKANNQYCLDYYNIDTHDMNDTYWSDAGDDGNSESYGGNYYHDFQNSNDEGSNWFYNRINPEPGANIYSGEHTTQHITGNRKAFAFWWILARIAGWNPEQTPQTLETNIKAQSKTINVINNGTNKVYVTFNNIAQDEIVAKLYNLNGQLLKVSKLNFAKGNNSLSLENLPNGNYILKTVLNNKRFSNSINIIN